MPIPRYDDCVRNPSLGVIAFVFAIGLTSAFSLFPVVPRTAPIFNLAEGGCPEGSEPYGVLITKSGAAYLVCRDKEGGGLIYVPLTAEKGAVLDA